MWAGSSSCTSSSSRSILYRTPWRELWRDKAGIRPPAGRGGVLHLSAHAAATSRATAAAVLVQIAVAFILHAGIICGLHLRRATA
jgi:hypothetical protein